jgi:hypothetical protein
MHHVLWIVTVRGSLCLRFDLQYAEMCREADPPPHLASVAPWNLDGLYDEETSDTISRIDS